MHQSRHDGHVHYGAHLKSEWLLDPHVAYLNHGTVGAPPIRVLNERKRLLDEIEHQPAQFLLRELADVDASGAPAVPRMRVAAERVAQFVGAKVDNLGFVDNATTGVNAVLRSFPFTAGDELLYTSLGYGGVNHAVAYAAERSGATTRVVTLPQPGAAASDYVAAIEEQLRAQTRMLIVDHITSQTALVLPLREIATLCHQHGVLVLADGAHAPGAIDLDVESLGVDWYAANLHKWAFTPRSSGFLWAAPEHHATLRPTVISWGWKNGLAAEFDLLGTRDPTPWLVSGFAIDLYEEWGGHEICQYNHSLVFTQAKRLAEAWGTSFATPEELIGTMAYVSLPDAAGSSRADAVGLQAALLAEDHIEVPVFADEGRLTCRLSAQIYNDARDFDRLMDAVIRRCEA